MAAVRSMIARCVDVEFEFRKVNGHSGEETNEMSDRSLKMGALEGEIFISAPGFYWNRVETSTGKVGR